MSLTGHSFLNLSLPQSPAFSHLALKHFMEKESLVPEDKEATLRCDTPDIELKDVCVEMDGQEILKHINISIPYGKKLGIVGETGSGKTFLSLNLHYEKNEQCGLPQHSPA